MVRVASNGCPATRRFLERNWLKALTSKFVFSILEENLFKEFFCFLKANHLLLSSLAAFVGLIISPIDFGCGLFYNSESSTGSMLDIRYINARN
jgi:hypothetical protein